MHLKSLNGCELAIGSYPKFQYNATSGGGEGQITSKDDKGVLIIVFNPETFVIPSLNWRTTKILGVPMLPGLEIKVIPQPIKCYIEKQKGIISLEFKARFIFSLFKILQAPALVIETSLKSKKVRSRLFEAIGSPINENGLSTLVGVATVPETTNKYLNRFLSLPNEALAILHCEITEFACSEESNQSSNIKRKNNLPEEINR